MKFFEVLKNRHSIRAYKDKEIEEDKIYQILQAANSAPSAGNLQSYEIILIRDKERKKRIARASYNQNFIAQAPIVLIFCANLSRSSVRYGERGEKLYAIQDATIACTYAQLAATALGLASCWIGAFDEREIKEIINAPDYIKPIAILPIGYAAEEPYITSRRKLSDLVKEESF
jgi:nitroreductase